MIAMKEFMIYDLYSKPIYLIVNYISIADRECSLLYEDSVCYVSKGNELYYFILITPCRYLICRIILNIIDS